MRRWWTVGVLAMAAASTAIGKEWVSGILWPEPALVDPGPVGGPPSDAVVLFGGSDLSAWNGGDKWLVNDGVATAHGGGITTKDAFGDCQLHLEWASPDVVSGSGQGRGNSGVYFGGRYEVQILDSYDNKTYFDGQAAAIYKTKPPLVNASRKPGEWQTYDIIYHAPRFDQHGQLLKPGYLTVLHNGLLVQDHTELLGTTAWDAPPQYTPHDVRQPIHLQFHGNPVRFRNIWIREIADIVGQRPE
jgi:hypothetical protein